ncbi:hypothetical protein D1N62_20110, partial [Clostridioides difficile]
SQYFPCSEEEEISQINVQAAYPSDDNLLAGRTRRQPFRGLVCFLLHDTNNKNSPENHCVKRIIGRISQNIARNVQGIQDSTKMRHS